MSYHGSLSKILSLRSSLQRYLDSPELLLSENELPEFDRIHRQIITVQDGCAWNESDLVGWLAPVQDVMSYLRNECELTQKHELVVALPRSHSIIVPSRETTAELISRVGSDQRAWKALGSRRFEEILAEIWAGLGWETILTPPSGDGGFDIRAIRNSQGVMVCYLIEAKAYDPQNPVGVELVRHLYGVVERERVSHGILATTSRFTRGAKEEARALRYRVSLADFSQVLAWSQEYLRIQSGYRYTNGS